MSNQQNKKEENKFPIKDTEEFFEHILDLNLEIENKIFKKSVFKDPSLEKKFEEFNQIDIRRRLLGDMLIILGNIVSVFYVIFFIFETELIIIFGCNLAISIIISIICFCKKITADGNFLDHLNVFIMNGSLVAKAFLVIFYYSNDYYNEKLNTEMLRIIIYHFVLLNMVIMLKFDASFTIFTFYFISNIVVIILAIVYSNQKGVTFEFEAGISFGFTYIMFGFRKLFEYLIRLIFSEKYRFEKLYKYTSHFIKGLEHNYIVTKGEQTIFINEKFSQDLNREEIFPISNNYQNLQSEFENSSINLHLKKKDYISVLKQLVLIEEDLIDYNIQNREINRSYKRIHSFRENNLWKIVQEIKEKDLIEKDTFLKVGTFQFLNKDINIYYTIVIRNHTCMGDECYMDFLFFDVSEFILMRKRIHEENLIKERVIAKLAHELKTPINSIIGMINLLNESNDNFRETKLDEIKCITSLSNYTIYLVNDIIQCSSNKDNKNVRLNKETIEVKELIEFCYDILESLLNTNKSKLANVKPVLDIDPIISNVRIYSDEIRLKQILLNLISNSVKFCNRGKITIKCNYESQNVNITVSDTGIGIKEEDLNKIFKDFVMLEDESNLNKQGSGLGLSICKTLIDLLKVDLKFNSVYGSGTEANLIIPISEIVEPSLLEEDEEDEEYEENDEFEGENPHNSNK